MAERCAALGQRLSAKRDAAYIAMADAPLPTERSAGRSQRPEMCHFFRYGAGTYLSTGLSFDHP